MAAHDAIFDGGGSGEGIFTRIGKVGAVLNATNTFRGTTLPGGINGLHGLFVATHQEQVDSLYSAESAAVAGLSSILATARQVAQGSVTVAYQDSQGPDSNFVNALNWMIGRMKLSTDTVKGSTPTAAVAAVAGNVGQAVVVASLKGSDGHVQENAVGEVVTGSVTSDSQSAGVVVGAETWTFKGTTATADAFSPSYPTGSGASAQLTAVDPTSQQGIGGTKNWTVNGNFETWTVPNIPDRWTIQAGTPGATILRSTTSLDGAYSLEFVGNGSEDTAISQTLANTSGTTAAATPLQQIVANLFYLRPGTLTTGTLELALVDGSGVVTLDARGVANSVSVSVVGAATPNWVPLSAVFRTPASLPSTLALRVRMSVALTAAEALLVDRVGLALPTALYPGGPSVAVFSNPAFRVINNDAYAVTVTNAYAGHFQWLFDKLFNMKAKGLLLPSVTDGSETIPDSLIA